ncbi:MAG TPA: aldehyde dehydrogenase family protein, partial [Ferruginibacter sp.]|nr:aldehyde dehydrogenase family protein [Ferruginibacter sp.]
MKYNKVQNFINGRFVDSASTRSLDIHSPVDGTHLSVVPMSGADELNQAVAAAQAAFHAWSHTPIKERVQV